MNSNRGSPDLIEIQIEELGVNSRTSTPLSIRQPSVEMAHELPASAQTAFPQPQSPRPIPPPKDIQTLPTCPPPPYTRGATPIPPSSYYPHELPTSPPPSPRASIPLILFASNSPTSPQDPQFALQPPPAPTPPPLPTHVNLRYSPHLQQLPSQYNHQPSFPPHSRLQLHHYSHQHTPHVSYTDEPSHYLHPPPPYPSFVPYTDDPDPHGAVAYLPDPEYVVSPSNLQLEEWDEGRLRKEEQRQWCLCSVLILMVAIIVGSIVGLVVGWMYGVW